MKRFGITSTAILCLLLASGVAYSQQEPKNEKQDHPQREESKQQQAKPDPQHAQQEQHQQRQEQSKQNEQHAQQQQRQEQSKQNEQHVQQQQRQEQSRQNEQHAQQQQRQEQSRQNEQHAQQQQRQEKSRQNEQHAQQQQRQEQSRQNEQHAQQHQNAPAQHSQEQHQALRTSFQEHRSQRWDSDHRTWQQRGGYNGYRIPDDRFQGRFGEDHAFRIYGLPFMTVGGYPRFQYEGYWFSMIDPWPGSWANDWYDNDDVYVVYVDNGYYLFNRRYPNIGMAISISM